MEEGRLDVHQLFSDYNSLYFDGALACCSISWSSSTKIRSTGFCSYLEGGGCEIRLSELLLKFRSAADVKNTLLHEMIHAFLYVMSGMKEHSYHGPKFMSIMTTINSSSVIDPQRPPGGYNITIHHHFQKKVESSIVHQWICETCGDLIKRVTKKIPSANDCIENLGHEQSCGNSSCHWHKHMMQCCGKYIEMVEQPGHKVKRRVSIIGTDANDRNKSNGSSNSKKQSSGISRVQKMNINSDVQKSKRVAKFSHSVGDATMSAQIKPLSGNAPQSRSADETKQLKRMELLMGSHTLEAEFPKRVRTPRGGKKRNYTCTEKMKPKKCTRETRKITVAIPCLDCYADEESEEDIQPLVNKRSVRRKKEREWKEQIRKWLDNNATDCASPSQDDTSTDPPLLCNDGEKWKPGTALEDRSPVEDNVVYISDS